MVAWVIQNRMIAEELSARSRSSLARQESDSSDDEVLSHAMCWPRWAYRHADVPARLTCAAVQALDMHGRPLRASAHTGSSGA